MGDVHHHDWGLHDGPILEDPDHARLDAFITTMTMRCMTMLSMMPPRLYLNSKDLHFFILKPFHSCASDSIFYCLGSFSSLGQSLLGPASLSSRPLLARTIVPSLALAVSESTCWTILSYSTSTYGSLTSR